MAGAALFGFFIAVSCFSGQSIFAPFFLLFFIPSVYLFYCFGTLELNGDYIRIIAPAGIYEMPWSDIKEAEFGQSQIVLKGKGRRLVVPHPTFWSPKDRKAGIDTLHAFFSVSGISPKQRYFADFKLSKNTKKKKLSLTDVTH